MARIRLADASALIADARWSGGYYLLGLSVECALKACILRGVQAEVLLPRTWAEKFYRHDLSQLLVMAELEHEAAFAASARLEANWATAKDWDVDARYTDVSQTDAESLFAAVNEPVEGVFAWLATHF